MPHILMFAPQVYPPRNPQGIVTAKLVIALMEAGWTLDLVAEEPDDSARYPWKDGTLWQPMGPATNCLAVDRNGWVGGVWRRARGLIRLNGHRPVLWPSAAVECGLRLARKRRPDFILSRSYPEYGHLPALIVSRRLNVPWIANYSDPVPMVRCPPPHGKGPQAPIPLAADRLLRQTVRQASWHTFQCERMRQYVASYLPGLQEKSSVIPQIALRKLCPNSSHEHKIFSLCHTGALGKERDPGTFLEGIRRFMDASDVRDGIELAFLGSRPGALLPLAKSMGLESFVRDLGAKSYEETVEILPRHTVLVVIEAPVEEGIFPPSKFVDYVQAGRPILAVSPRVGTMADVLGERGGGIAVDCRDPQAVADAVTRMYRCWKEGTLDATYGSDRLFEVYGEQRVLALYEDLFARLRRTPRPPDGRGWPQAG